MFALFLLLGLIMPAISAHSGGIPAQELLRQQERERALREQQESRPDVRLPSVAAPAIERYPEDEQPCFTIQSISLVGKEADRFAFALAAVTSGSGLAVGRCLGVVGINVVIGRVQNAIIERGYVTTRVLAAPQDLKSGELQLTVVPGRVRDIRLAPDSAPRGTLWNSIPIAPGDILNLRDIEQALENLKRPPTADADIRIEPAAAADAKPGESDLVIIYRQGFPFRLTLTADDGGAKDTGKHQGSVTVSGDNLLTLNDLFYVSYNHDLSGDSGDKGTRGNTVHYSLPYGYWLLAATASNYRYHQTVAGINQSYEYSGKSTNGEIALSRLLYRDAVRKTTVTLSTWLNTSRNYIDDTEIEVQQRRMAGWEASLAHREFLGSATLDAGLAWRRGTGAFNARTAPEEKLGQGTARSEILSADAALDLPFEASSLRLRYSGRWRAQWNDTPLVPQDRFAIGGRYTVRGFDGGTLLSADRGWLLRNDLGLALGYSGQELYLGVDYGHLGGESADLLPGRHLAGAVLGLRGGYQAVWWDLFVGGPLSEPDDFEPDGGVAGFNLSWTY